MIDPDYYDSCENAVRCIAKGDSLGMLAYLTKAERIRARLVSQAQARLEVHIIAELNGFWACTIESVAQAAVRKKAAMDRYVDQPRCI